MLKTNTQLKTIIFAAVFAVFMIPSVVSAGSTGSYDTGSWDGWNYGSGSYSQPVSYTDYSYTPSYSSYSPSYSSYGSSYTPSYSGYSYGSSYAPSYSGYSYGSSYIPYSGYSYSGSSIPSSKTSSNNNNTNTSTSSSASNASASASASSTNINNNINNNNVYVYTTPSGNAVVYNPSHISLTGYCNIVPTNPRLGQTVTATAYASGGIGDYSYTWSGDLTTNAYGVSTSFTSYTAGTKNITVTIRSGQEVVTKTCNVTFEGNYVNNYYNGYSNYSSSVTTGSPVSGVYMQKITTGTPVSGVYLNELPATGISLNFVHYMIAIMVLILATVSTFVYQVRRKTSKQIA